MLVCNGCVWREQAAKAVAPPPTAMACVSVEKGARTSPCEGAINGDDLRCTAYTGPRCSASH